ncbi:MAG: caspase family protein [Pseudomonadota bacterium]|nr:caspase family protein [Pseudomonadota bacterium]
MATQTYVLIIGLDAYPSLGPAATLHGPRNDARHWAQFARSGLDVAPAQVQVLTSPRLDPEQLGLPAGQVHGATLAEVDTALGALVDWLSAQEDGSSTALIVYSGHGAHLAPPAGDGPDTDFSGDRLALVLEDSRIDGGVLSGALVLNQLGARLGAEQLQRRVTVVIDACYDTVRAEAFDTVALGRELATQQDVRMRILLGATLGSKAYEGVIGGEWRSIYSFALLTLLGQWQRQVVNDVTVVLGSYSELTFRARELLAALGYADQSPGLAGTSRATTLPFNNPSVFAVPVPAAWTPDGFRRRKELSGNAGELGIYTFTLHATGNSQVIGQCLWVGAGFAGASLTVNTGGGGSLTVNKGKEIWWLGNTGMPQWCATATLKVAWVPFAATLSGGVWSHSFTPNSLVSHRGSNYSDAPAWVTGVPTADVWYRLPNANLFAGLQWEDDSAPLTNLYFVHGPAEDKPGRLALLDGLNLAYHASAPAASATVQAVNVSAI